MIGGGGLEPYSGGLHRQRARQVLTHLIAVWSELGHLRDQGHVRIAHRPPCRTAAAADIGEEIQAARILILRVAVREKRANIADGGGAAEGVDQRMADDVAVAVAEQTHVPGKLHPGQHQTAPDLEAVDIEADPYSHRRPRTLRLLTARMVVRVYDRLVTVEPKASRPYMPGYGIAGPTEGSGLLPWSWAVERLTGSRNYWVVTRWPDGRPHAMPVWGVWDQDAFWFSSSLGSRKARNLKADPRCTVATENTQEPVVLEGAAEIVTNPQALERMLALENAKYKTSYGIEMLDPAKNATIQVVPSWAFALDAMDFTGSPTRWVF